MYTFFGNKLNNQYNIFITIPNNHVDINGSITNIKAIKKRIFQLNDEG